MKATNDQITLAVDYVRATMPSSLRHHACRADARQIISRMAVALAMDEQMMLITLAEFHTKNRNAVDDMLVSRF